VYKNTIIRMLMHLLSTAKRRRIYRCYAFIYKS